MLLSEKLCIISDDEFVKVIKWPKFISRVISFPWLFLVKNEQKLVFAKVLTFQCVNLQFCCMLYYMVNMFHVLFTLPTCPDWFLLLKQIHFR